MKKFPIQPLAGAFLLLAASSAQAFDAAADIPQQWRYVPEYVQPSPSGDSWWKQYDDSLLNKLIAKAESNNYNVAAAIKRIGIAERQITAARASLYPVVGVSAGWNAARSAGAMTKPATASHNSDYFNVGANVSWEIDVFGRVAAKTKAAKAGVGVSRAEYDAVMVALCADVASAYFQLRTYREQYRVAKEHIVSQTKIVNMTQARLDAGLANALEVSQAKTVLLTTEASLPALESSIRTTANSLAVLTGAYPGELDAELLGISGMPPAPPMLPPGVPAELLRRRPDVVEAEMQLAQYAAQIGVAKKDFLPVLSLTGSVGTSSHDFGHLFGENSLEYSVAPTLSWTVFDGLARNNNVKEARLQLEEATDAYNMTVLTAVQEVENAISSYNAALAQVKKAKGAAEESERSFNLAIELYKEGLTDFINVMNAQLTYLENQNSLAEANGSVYASQVALYKALGGGIE